MQCGGWWQRLCMLAFGAGIVFGGCDTTPAVRMQSSLRSSMQAPDVVGKAGLVSPASAARTIAAVSAQSSEPDSVRALIAAIVALSDEPIYKDNDVELLIDGPSTYREMLAAIRTAEHYVHLETYIFASDDVGRQFADALIERARAGVAVCVLYDAVGSFESAAEFFERLRSAGVELQEYHGFDLANVAALNTRDHRKILVVDGRVAFTGGINVTREYSSSSVGRRARRDPVADGWRDTHIMVRGPAVAGFEKLFAENWRSQERELDSNESFVPAAAHGDDLVQIVHARGGEGEYSTIYYAYLRAMELATDRIWITQAYFAPDRRFLDTLRAAAGRGVDVRIIVPGVSDIGMILHASRSRYGDLLRAGVRLYETQDAVLHAKTAVIDGVWSTVGSSNLDYRSFLHNDEVNAIVLGPRFGAMMETQFRKDTNAARLVALKDWEARPMYDRGLEVLSRVIDYWL